MSISIIFYMTQALIFKFWVFSDKLVRAYSQKIAKRNPTNTSFFVPFQIYKFPHKSCPKKHPFWRNKIQIYCESFGQIQKISLFRNPLIKDSQMIQKSNNLEKILAYLPIYGHVYIYIYKRFWIITSILNFSFIQYVFSQSM